MSQYPPPLDPVPYATPNLPQPNRRPTSVTVFAIIGIIWGSLAVLGGVCSLPQYLGVNLAPNPVMDAIRNDHVLLAFNIGSLVITAILGAMLLTAGIGALSLKRSARRMMVLYALINLVIVVVSTPLNYALIFPRMERDVQSVAGGNTALVSAFKIGSIAGVFGALLGIVWALLILYYMTRPHVKAAFGEEP